MNIEKSILGSLLNNNALADKMLDEVTQDLFADTKHQQILHAMKELKQKKTPIHLVSLYEKLKHLNISPLDLTAISDQAFTSVYFEENLKTLREKAAKRKLFEVIKNIANTIAKDLKNNETITVKSDILEKINAIKLDSDNSQNKAMLDVMSNTINFIEDKHKNKHDTSNRTGIIGMDKLTGGLHSGELTILASRPGVGKTAFALQIAAHMASAGKKILFFSREMHSTQLGIRLLSKYTNISGNLLRTGYLKDEHFDKIASVSAEITGLSIWINETASTVQEMRAAIRKQQNITGIDLVIIDYLQLLTIETSGRNREQEVAAMSRQLKLMTLEYEIPIICLSQLNRKAEDRRPQLGDLRESGALEQDADNVIFLSLCSKEKAQEKGLMQSNNRMVIELGLAKQRNGAVGIVDLFFIPSKLTFQNIDHGGE